MVKIDHIRHLALDLDGTLYLGGRLFECTLPFLKRLDQLGIGHTFFTNNSSRSTREYVEHLNHLGIVARAGDIYSSTHATLDYLRSEMPEVKRLYVLGTPALQAEFVENGFAVVEDEEPDAVVVGYDTSLTHERLCRAAWWIARGKTFLATNPDRVCPTDKPVVLVDCGSMCQMLTHATGVSPHAVLGKPNPQMLRGLMRRRGVVASELAVVGDRIYTDMAMARAAGAMGILVLSGEATREVAQAASPPPDLIVKDVGELAELLGRARA
jgi:HAD superfamily hydrolase (TIGR01450 family)